MTLLTNALNTPFTPAVGDFIIQVTGGQAAFLRRGSSSDDWTEITPVVVGGPIVSNPVAGAEYKFVSSQNVTVRAYQ